MRYKHASVVSSFCPLVSLLRPRNGKIKYPMKIAIGADHAGFGLKREIAEMLRAAGHNVIDEGTNNTESTDYPD